MKLNKLLFILILALMTGCSGGHSSGSGTTAATLVSLAVTPVSPSITLGTTEQFTATGTFSDNTTQDLTNSVTWSSSAASVATISTTGKAIAVAAGTTAITAASGGISASTTLTVTATTLVSLNVTPANPSIAVGTTQQFAATGTFSDNTTQDLTNSVTWSSSAASVATISNAAGSRGTATALAAGTTTITAASGNVSASAALTVTAGSSGSANNVLSLTVNGSLCSPATSNGYLNKPCVSVTICTPGTSTCQTITDLLLDTGSFGLRIFKQALTVSLPSVAAGSGSLANCVQFADGSADWGPVQLADIVLGNEPAITVPIQVIDATFSTVPTACGIPDLNPSAAGFNGILGVGLFAQDCGTFCVNNTGAFLYYSCTGATCTETKVPLANQVWNPVAKLPVDNNGVIVQLPSVPDSGAPSVNGSLVLGIDTQSNNSSTGVTMYTTNGSPEMLTTFNGITYKSIIDSGSNGLFFTASSANQLPTCGSPNTSWFCPSSLTNLSATNKGALGTPSSPVSFKVGNFTSLTSGANQVFSDIGGAAPNTFDWGLPFYFGRNIYVGIEGRTSGVGTGPYFAY